MGNINIEIKPTNLPPVIPVSQYDVNRRIELNLVDDTTAYIPPVGTTAVMQGTKPSGLGFTATGTVSGSKVVFETTEELSDEPGRIPAEVVLTSEGQRIGTANFILAIEASPHPDGTTDGTAEHLVSELTVLVERAEAADQSVQEHEDAAHVHALNAEAYANRAEQEADRAEQAADRAEGVQGISLISGVTWADNGFNTTGSLYEDVVEKSNRAISSCAYPCILSLTAQADSSFGAWVKSYDQNGKPLRLDGITINRNPSTYTVPSGAKFIRISVAATGAAGADALNIKISMRQDLTALEEMLNHAAIDVFNSKPIPAPFTLGTINQVARLGWKPSAGGYPPVQSLPSYALAYENKIRIMLADVRLTADGEYVCWHDENLVNSQIRHPDGSALTDEEKAQLIENMTLEEIDAYDFGIFKGQQYAGLKMLRLNEFLQWCADMNCWAILEMKVQLTTEQIEEMSMMVKRHKMGERTIIAAQYLHMDTPEEDPGYVRYLENLPKASYIIFGGQTRWERTANICKAIAQEGVTVYIGHTQPTQLTQAMIDEVRAEGIGIMNATDITDEATLQSYYESGYIDYYDMISSSWVNIIDYVYNRRMND